MKKYIFNKLFICILGFTLPFSSCTLNKQRKNTAIEIAKTQFALSHFDKEDVPFDSVYTRNDTVLFYKNGSFVGKSVISIQ